MTPQEITDRLVETFGDAIIESFPLDKHPRIHINAESWRDIAEFARFDPSLNLDFLLCITGVDYVADNKLACVYDLRAFDIGHEFAIKVFTDRDQPSIPTVSDLWPAANWHEREAFDMFGIDFPNHPDLRRILMSEDWTGHPLLKDYEFPREYHGIPMSYELNWQQKPTYPK